MRDLFLLVLFLCFFGCATTSGKPTAPQSLTFEQTFSDKLYVEIHNTKEHCLVRVWNLKISEDSPQVIFRGTPGSESCHIYNIVNPDIDDEPDTPAEGCGHHEENEDDR